MATAVGLERLLLSRHQAPAGSHQAVPKTNACLRLALVAVASAVAAAPVVAAVVASAAGVVEAGEGAVVASAASTAAVVRETVLAFLRGRHHGSILPRAHPIERRNHGVHHQRRQQQKSQLPHDQGPQRQPSP